MGKPQPRSDDIVKFFCQPTGFEARLPCVHWDIAVDPVCDTYLVGQGDVAHWEERA